MTDKTLFITGASSGIGAATARAAVAAGWNVGLFARSEGKVADLAAELGDRALTLPGDATSHDDQARAVSELVDRFGGLDAAFANAGVGIDRPGTEAGDPAEWDALVDINVKGILYTAHATLPHLRPRKGDFLVMGSVAGRMHVRGSIYSASKWFVHGFAGNLAEEMNPWGGNCTIIAPGQVDTPFFDAGAPGKLRAEDVAGAVMYALSTPRHMSVREVYMVPTEGSRGH
ncbi:MAG: SDR family NAD(P)-dependent oxidoreductase [Pseudomonadota bacterium]